MMCPSLPVTSSAWNTLENGGKYVPRYDNTLDDEICTSVVFCPFPLGFVFRLVPTISLLWLYFSLQFQLRTQSHPFETECPVCVACNFLCLFALLRDLPFFDACLFALIDFVRSVFVSCRDRVWSRGRPTWSTTRDQTFSLPELCTAPATVTLVSSGCVFKNIRSIGSYAITLLFIASLFFSDPGMMEHH